MLDTPGVLWPKFENEEVGLKLAYTGTIKDDVLQTIEIGFSLLKYLISSYKENLIERYKLDENQQIVIDDIIEEKEKDMEAPSPEREEEQEEKVEIDGKEE